MNRFILAVFGAMVLLPAAHAGAQVSRVPDIGELMSRSRDVEFITDGCLLTYDKKDRRFGCANTRLVSISRPAESFSLASRPAPAVLLCDPGAPCSLIFPENTAATASIDWVMPSQALVGKSLLLSWRGPNVSGIVYWLIDWCRYGVGELPCLPSGEHELILPSQSLHVGARTDLILEPFTPAWGAGDHIVLDVERVINSGDDMSGDAHLENLRLEWTQ